MISFLKSDDCNYITEQVLKRLTSVSSNSRRILNILNLIDFLLKNGSSKFKGEIEEEKFYLRKMKDNFNDDYDILHKPIQNIITNIVDLLSNAELLQKERDDAKKIRERIKGVSNETPVQEEHSTPYQGYSSDDIKKQSYDIQPEINLKKKLGFEEEVKKEDTKNDIQNNKQLEQKQQDEIDFLGEFGQEDNTQTVKTEQKQEKPKKKVFLPPPPKKGKNQTKTYHKKPSNQPTQNNNDDLISFDVDIDQQPQQQTQNNKKDVQKNEVDILDMDFLEQETQQIELNNNKEQNKKEEVKETKKDKNDVFDFVDLDLKQEKKENQIDNYLNFLQNTSANRLPQPPKKINNNSENKYDFF